MARKPERGKWVKRLEGPPDAARRWRSTCAPPFPGLRQKMLFRHGMEMARHRVGAGVRILAFKGIDDHQMLVDGFFHPPLQTDIVRAVVGKELVQMADNVDENRVSGCRRLEGMELGVQFAVVLPVQEF